MRLTRVFVDRPLVPEREVELRDSVAHHLSRVLRLRAGAPLVGFDGTGSDYRCEILAIEGDRVRVRVGPRLPGLPESPLGITLVQAVSRGERMDWTLQKATELGVRTIAPVLSARSVVRLDERQSEKKLRHWQGIVAAACEQCGRSVPPEVRPPRPLDDYLADPAPGTQRLVLSPVGPASLAGLASLEAPVELLIGPEGGLEDAELSRAAAAAFAPVRLGPRILRTETAAIVALTVLQALWGDLR